jgi:hypothetical protein
MTEKADAFIKACNFINAEKKAHYTVIQKTARFHLQSLLHLDTAIYPKSQVDKIRAQLCVLERGPPPLEPF